MDCFFVDQEAIARSVSHVPPAHYIVKIESYSLLAKNEVDKYQSEEFESCGYKWKLVIYPTGNERENVKDHISFYLAIANTTSVGFGWEIYAIFRLFLLDQKKDRFLIVQGRERRFHGLKIKWGFDQFIPLDEFNDASNGYLMDDTCVFGAEVFVKEKGKGKGECLSIIQTTSCFTCVWKIEKFSEVGEKVLHSEVFSAGGRKWKIVLYPKGSLDGTSTCLFMYLKLEDSTTLTLSSKIFANFTLRS